MKKTNRFIAGLSALAVVISAGLTASPAFAAGPNTCLWTGATDTLFSTATNWSNCGGVAPQAGDIIAFDNSGAGSSLTNDLSVALGGVQMLGGASFKNYTIDTLTLAPAATIIDQATPGRTYLYIPGAITGQGDVALSATLGNFGLSGGDWNVAGNLSLNGVSTNISTVNGGTLSLNSLSSGSATVTINGTAVDGATVNTAEAVNLTNVSGLNPSLTFMTAGVPTQNFNVSGPVSLSSDGTVCAETGAVVTFTGALTTNGHALTQDKSGGCSGTVNFNWSNAAALTGSSSSGSSAPKAPNTSKTGVSQANIAAPIFGAILVAAGILGVRSLATRKR